MLDKNDLEAIAQLMDSKLTPINGRLDRMETRLDQGQEDIESLKEDSATNRNGVNALLEWAEKHRCRCRFHFSKRLDSLYT